VVLERRRGDWRALRRTRTGSDRRFAFRLPAGSAPLRLRLPAVTRAHAGAPVRCAAARDRVARR
jgi:hypothetical protein